MISCQNPDSNYLHTHLSILICLLLIFTIKITILYFILWEVSLIPISLIILGWGYQPERSNAFMYIFIYTFVSAVPLLLILIFVRSSINMWIFQLEINILPITIKIKSTSFSTLMVLITTVSILVKFPLYYLHFWLPKAHVEAPLNGSMILAGLLLKLGGFGWFLLLPLIQDYKFILFLTTFARYGAVRISFLCLRQIDIKVLIAYSSVSHLGVVIISFGSGTTISYLAGVIIIVAHGFSSPGIFYTANYFYRRSNSRNIFLTSRITSFTPRIVIFWFLLCISNISAPPSRNLFSEIIAITGLINCRPEFSLQIFLLIFLAGVYTLILYSSTSVGQRKNPFFHGFQTSKLEFQFFFFIVFIIYSLTLIMITI